MSSAWKLWWKGILPTLALGLLVIELMAGGMYLLNVPEDWAVAGGAVMLSSIVVVVGAWVSWIRKSFFQEQK